MHPAKWLCTDVAEIVAVAMADKVVDKEADEELDTRCANANMAKWTIIPPKLAERGCSRKITQTMAIQTPPGMMSKHASTAVTLDTSWPTASTLNMPGIKII